MPPTKEREGNDSQQRGWSLSEIQRWAGMATECCITTESITPAQKTPSLSHKLQGCKRNSNTNCLIAPHPFSEANLVFERGREPILMTGNNGLGLLQRAETSQDFGRTTIHASWESTKSHQKTALVYRALGVDRPGWLSTSSNWRGSQEGHARGPLPNHYPPLGPEG